MVLRRLGAERSTGLRLDGGLIDRGRTSDVAVEGGSGGNEVVFYFVDRLGAGTDRDAGCVDALLLDQVVLGVDRALSSEVVNRGRMLLLALGWSFLRSCFTNHDYRRIRLLLGVQCYFVEAGLGFVVDAGWTLGVTKMCIRDRRQASSV